MINHNFIIQSFVSDPDIYSSDIPTTNSITHADCTTILASYDDPATTTNTLKLCFNKINK